MSPSIQLLPANQIDTDRWNACIRDNTNGLIYSQTQMLNTLADNWHGLIIDDYTSVLPIPWRKKWGVRYAYVPAFMQQLGLTGKLDESLLRSIMPYIDNFIALGDFQFNFENAVVKYSLSGATSRINQMINLHKSYHDLHQQFTHDAKRNIHHSEKYQFTIQHSWREDIWDYFFAEMKSRYTPKLQDIYQFKKSCAAYFAKNECHIRWIENEKKELLTGWVGLQDSRRIYNLLNVTTKEGRKKSANYFLFNALMQEWCENPLIFDCEGSELPGVQSFYNQWGAATETYFQFRLNRLPLPFRLFKR